MASDNTEARRERVRELWIKPDRKIAEILIEEGFAGDEKHTADGKRTQLSSMQRNVWNDRVWWKKTWRDQKRITSSDASETRGEHLAVLESLKQEGIEKLGEGKLKGTPWAQTLQAVTRIVEATAKMNGVAELEPVDPDSEKGATPQVVGLVIGGRNLSPEMKKDLSEQGYAFDDEDHADKKRKRKRRRRKTSASSS